jgi:hypothetical protein
MLSSWQCETELLRTTVPDLSLSLLNLGLHARLSLRFPDSISLAGPAVSLSIRRSM